MEIRVRYVKDYVNVCYLNPYFSDTLAPCQDLIHNVAKEFYRFSLGNWCIFNLYKISHFRNVLVRTRKNKGCFIYMYKDSIFTIIQSLTNGVDLSKILGDIKICLEQGDAIVSVITGVSQLLGHVARLSPESTHYEHETTTHQYFATPYECNDIAKLK